LNGSASEILRRCDGATTVQALIRDLETTFDTAGLESDVLAFLDMARAQRWVEPA
ncbi:MAG: pyrroloquinoline quinone biosynthesis peptide chaperone PqqD, partial [Luteimonas sp.]